MIQLIPEILKQIDQEALDYGNDFGKVLFDGYDTSDDREYGYHDGAKKYALKWQQAEEMMEKMAATLLEISNGGATPQYKAIQAINLYNNYKQTKDGI